MNLPVAEFLVRSLNLFQISLSAFKFFNKFWAANSSWLVNILDWEISVIAFLILETDTLPSYKLLIVLEILDLNLWYGSVPANVGNFP